MKRSSTLLLCGTLFLAGMAIGVSFDGWLLPDHVLAKGLDSSEVDRLYDELSSETNSLVENSRLLAKIARVATPSVVHIQSEHRNNRGGTVEETGSGVIITSKRASGYFIVTNRHVINRAPLNDVSIRLHDGRMYHPVRVWNDAATDIAVLKVNASNLRPARWGDSDKLEIGHMVLAMGSPFGLSQSVTLGIVSAKGRRSLKLGVNSAVLNQDFLQTDAAINPGNSGGPLIDLHGRVVGINTAIASNSGGNDGIGFSIPSALVRRVVDDLLAHGHVRRAYLGVKLDAHFNANAARRLKLDHVRGARVSQVYTGTPASRAGLKIDDVILEFNGIKVQDENHLINLVSLKSVGSRVKLVVFRNGQRNSIEVLLSDRAELEQRSEAPQSTRPGYGVLVEPMGLTLHPIDPSIAEQLGYGRKARGLLVLNVDSSGPLNDKLQLYDLIEEVSRKSIASVDDLQQALSMTDSDDTVVLKVRNHRDGTGQSRIVLWQR